MDLRSTAARLTKDLVARERSLEAAAIAHNESHRVLTEELGREKEAAAQLKQELSTRPSTQETESLRRQLKALHQLEFNVQDGDNASSLTTVAIGKKSAKGGELSLGEELTENIHAKEANNPEETPGGSEMEQLLMARLRRVENSAMASRRYDPIRSDPIPSRSLILSSTRRVDT
mmetsp:Transcript_63226/g.173762  ORF Transcript_63226/g.173762 Transcript_63226/m.173762 type:complete len:175 (+) Transcript_63226:54-578(+)